VPTNRYGFAVTYLASSMIQEKHQHHIPAFTSSTDLTPEKVKLPPLRKLLQGKDGLIWNYSNANEFGRLLPRGVGKSRPPSERIEGTSTMFPIRKSQIPTGRRATYARFVPDIRPQKAEKFRVRLTAGGDQLEFPGDPSSPSTSIIDSKIHINSTISMLKKELAT
jgi:hypothetical protein